MQSTESPNVPATSSASSTAFNATADRPLVPAGWPVGVHPAASVFPMLYGTALDELASDIRLHGLREPIVVYQGLVLDGRNRLRGCDLAGVEPRFVEWDGAGSLVGFVLSRNLHRRHLNESQRAMVAARAKPLFEEEAAERQAAGRLRGNAYQSTEGFDRQKAHEFPVCANLHKREMHSNAEAAALLNVSTRSVATATKVLEQGDAELVSAVESGSVAVSDAAAVALLPSDEQRQAVERVKSGKARTLRQAARHGRHAAANASTEHGSAGERPGDELGTPAEMRIRHECAKIGEELGRLLRRSQAIVRARGGAHRVTDRLIEGVNHMLRILHDGLASLTSPESKSDG
jgi:stalled ribosome alternative rescue factor ArfA